MSSAIDPTCGTGARRPCHGSRHAHRRITRRPTLTAGAHPTHSRVLGPMHSFRSETEAITHARRAAEDGWLSVDLRVGDVRALPTDVQADVAICMGNAFGYLEHASAEAFVGDLGGLVVPGGAPVLDYGFVAESLLPGLALQEEPMTIEGVEATSVNTYDTVESRFSGGVHVPSRRRGAPRHVRTARVHRSGGDAAGHRGGVHECRAVWRRQRLALPARQPPTPIAASDE